MKAKEQYSKIIVQFLSSIRKGLGIIKANNGRLELIEHNWRIVDLMSEFYNLSKFILSLRNKKYSFIPLRSLLELFWLIETSCRSHDSDKLLEKIESRDYELLGGCRYPIPTAFDIKVPSKKETSKASRLKFYNYHYAVLSGVVHVNPLTLRALDRQRSFWYSFGLYTFLYLIVGIIDLQLEILEENNFDFDSDSLNEMYYLELEFKDVVKNYKNIMLSNKKRKAEMQDNKDTT